MDITKITDTYIWFMWEMVQLESANVEEGDMSGNKSSLSSCEISASMLSKEIIFWKSHAWEQFRIVWDEKKGNGLKK